VTWVYTSGFIVRVRIKALPEGKQLEGFDLRVFEMDRVYELGARLAELLIVLGFAEPEMRRAERDNTAGKSRRAKFD
jgi:hypothetical protein